MDEIFYLGAGVPSETPRGVYYLIGTEWKKEEKSKLPGADH